MTKFKLQTQLWPLLKSKYAFWWFRLAGKEYWIDGLQVLPSKMFSIYFRFLKKFDIVEILILTLNLSLQYITEVTNLRYFEIYMHFYAFENDGLSWNLTAPIYVNVKCMWFRKFYSPSSAVDFFHTEKAHIVTCKEENIENVPQRIFEDRVDILNSSH